MITQANALNFEKINANHQHPEIWYTTTHTVPTISLQISFPIGYAFDPDDKLGLATMVAATMDEGSGALDSDAFRKELVDNQISLHYEASQKRFTLSLNFLKFDAEKALELAQLSLNKPRFDSDSLELMRQQLIATLENNRKNPDNLANNLLRHTYYKGHVFEKSNQGTLKTLKNITRDDLINFHKKLSLQEAFVSVVGDISQEDIVNFTKTLFSDLPKKSDVDTTIADFNLKAESHKINVYSDIPQSTVIMATPSVKRTDTTFFATYLATHILGGGGFGSQLINELREKNGLTYSASAYLDSSLYDGRLLIQFATDNKKLDTALSETEKTLARLSHDGVTQKQLNKAKVNLKGQYILAFETNEDIAGLAQSLYSYGLPHDYPQKRDALFDAVTLSDVNTVMKKLFIQPLTIITVGGNRHIKDFKSVSVDDILF
jgi:zinc protease